MLSHIYYSELCHISFGYINYKLVSFCTFMFVSNLELLTRFIMLSPSIGLCGRASAHGAMDFQIDPS